MLARLSKYLYPLNENINQSIIVLGATEEIQEVLLDQQQILSALQLARDTVSPRKYLQAAQNSGDPALFHSTLYYFKSNPQYASIFQKGKWLFICHNIEILNAVILDKRLDTFIQYYKVIFPE